MANKFCPNCGFKNSASANFCVKCGTKLTTGNGKEEEVIFETEEVKAKKKKGFHYFKYIGNACFKPYETFKKEENNLGDIKIVSILSLIVIGFVTLISLLTITLSTIRVTSRWTGEVRWVLENISSIDFMKIILQNVLVMVAIIGGIAGIYYLGCKIIKKNIDFVKLVGTVVTALIPFIAIITLVAPILGFIYFPFGVIASIMGIIYFIVVLIELMNELISIKDINVKICFHATILSIFLFIAYIFIFNILWSLITSSVSVFGRIW